jgi:hypothetical protein
MHFDGNRVTPQFIPSGQKGNLNDRMRILLEPALEGTQNYQGDIVAINRGQLLPGTKLLVNLFDGGERDSVQVSLNEGEFLPMQNVIRTDPFMVRQHAKYQGTPDAFSTPVASSHIWEYPLPHDLSPGLHTFVVKSTDEFGQQAEQAFTMEILGE